MNTLFLHRFIHVFENLKFWKKNQQQKQVLDVRRLYNIETHEEKGSSKENEIVKMSLFIGHR